MTMGIYTDILKLINSVYNIDYIFSNWRLYFSFSLGMFMSFIITLSLIKYLFEKHRNFTISLILGLSLGSIYLLIMTVLNISFSLLELFLGILLFCLGIIVSYCLNK